MSQKEISIPEIIALLTAPEEDRSSNDAELLQTIGSASETFLNTINAESEENPPSSPAD